MLIYFNLLLLAFSTASQAVPSYWKRDADIASLHGLTNNQKDRSGKKGDPRDKYFHESTFHPHYDGRFAQRVLSYAERRQHLTEMLQTYLSTMHDIGAETWIMHGTLMGWWWNRKILPWDSDVDVQVSERSIQFLADYYNMTVHHYKIPGTEDEEGKIKGRNYMLEVNPHYKNGSIADKLNVIDARWIDMETGLFIDITTLRRNETAEALGLKGVMMCKDRHHYLASDIFPLRESVFEGMPVKIPYKYTELLEEEYTPKSLVVTDFENHHFDAKKMEWVPTQDPDHITKSKSGKKLGGSLRGNSEIGRKKEKHVVPGSSVEMNADMLKKADGVAKALKDANSGR